MSEHPGNQPVPDPEVRRDNVGRRLLRAFEAFEQRILERLHERGFADFRRSDSAALRNVDLEGTRITELAARASMTKQAMSQLVEGLEERGYVERRPDPSDGRAKLVVLTDRGLALIAAGQEANRELDERWSDLLGADEYARLRDMLRRLTRDSE